MDMDPQHTGDLLKHLEKQSEIFKEAQKTMLQELQNLQVEERMMMDKLNELLITHRLNKKRMEETQNVLEGKETDEDSGSTSERHLKVYTRRLRKDGNLVSTDVDAQTL